MSSKRPAVIWLSAQECTGCTESLLRPTHPTFEKLILDLISLDYHETVFAAAGLSDVLASLTLVEEQPGNVAVFGLVPFSLEMSLDVSPGISARLDHLIEAVAIELQELGYPLRPRIQDLTPA